MDMQLKPRKTDSTVLLPNKKFLGFDCNFFQAGSGVVVLFGTKMFKKLKHIS